MFRKKERSPVDESFIKQECESHGWLFVPGYYNLKGKWFDGYCKKNNDYFHITDRRNLPSIAKVGLIPQQDNAVSSVEVKKDKVINIFINEKDVNFMRPILHNMMINSIRYDAVILKIKVPYSKVQPVHKYKADFIWGLIRETVPPNNIEVFDTLFSGEDKKKLPVIKREFNEIKWRNENE
jgi:hypothetical protein